MRVVFLSPVGTIGGAERVLLAGIRALRGHLPGAEPTVVLLADGPLRESAQEAGAQVYLLPLPAALAAAGDTQLRDDTVMGKSIQLARMTLSAALPAFDFLRQFRTLLRRLCPHLVHSNGLKTHLLAKVAVPRGVPVSWHLHDFYSERPVIARLLKQVCGGVVGAVAISEAVRLDFESTLPGIPVDVVLNGVDTKHFSPAERNGRSLDRIAGLHEKEGVVRVGLIATYANWKGHDVFLDALAKLPSDLPIRGYVVGGSIYTTSGSQVTRSELEARVIRNGLTGRVGFVPFDPDPADVYRMLDVVTHASVRPEPFGLTIAEGMSTGRAVVVSAAGGAIELFTEGIDAVGHTPGDASELAAVILRLVNDSHLRNRLGSAARMTAISRLSLERFDREFVRSLKQFLLER